MARSNLYSHSSIGRSLHRRCRSEVLRREHLCLVTISCNIRRWPPKSCSVWCASHPESGCLRSRSWAPAAVIPFSGTVVSDAPRRRPRSPRARACPRVRSAWHASQRGRTRSNLFSLAECNSDVISQIVPLAYPKCRKVMCL